MHIISRCSADGKRSGKSARACSPSDDHDSSSLLPSLSASMSPTDTVVRTPAIMIFPDDILVKIFQWVHVAVRAELGHLSFSIPDSKSPTWTVPGYSLRLQPFNLYTLRKGKYMVYGIYMVYIVVNIVSNVCQSCLYLHKTLTKPQFGTHSCTNSISLKRPANISAEMT